jgi:hypothetical protein
MCSNPSNGRYNANIFTRGKILKNVIYLEPSIAIFQLNETVLLQNFSSFKDKTCDQICTISSTRDYILFKTPQTVCSVTRPVFYCQTAISYKYSKSNFKFRSTALSTKTNKKPISKCNKLQQALQPVIA